MNQPCFLHGILSVMQWYEIRNLLIKKNSIFQTKMEKKLSDFKD